MSVSARLTAPRLRTTLLTLLAGSMLTTPAIAAEAASADGTVDGVVVTGAEATYKVPTTRSTSKLALSLKETPQSVTVVTRDLMDDFNLTSVSNVMELTPGITVQESDSSRVAFNSRGFGVANFQLDGVPTTYSSGNSTMSDTGIYERVEIVRGATGLVTGSGDASATVNLVRKIPTADHRGSFMTQAGSWNLKRVEGDLSGPILAQRVRARLVAGFQDKDSYIDFLQEKKSLIYGVVEADLTENTILRVGYDWQHVKPMGTTWGTSPLYYRDGTPTDLPRSYNVASRWSTWDRKTQNLFAVVEHKMGEWVARAAINRRISDSTALLYYGFSGYPDRLTGAGLTVADYYSVYQEKELGFDVYATGPIELFGRRHELVFGANGYDRDGETLNDSINAAARPYSMAIPDFRTWDGRVPMPALNLYGTPASIARTTESGLYGAVRLNPFDGLKIIAGARSSKWKTRTDRYTLAGVYDKTTGAYEDDKITPYLGAVFDVTRQISAYLSYSALFKPQSNKDRNNEQLAPVVGANIEGGFKAEFLDGALYAVAIAFYVKQDNLAVLDPSVPDGFILPDGASAFIAEKGAKTRGAEFEVVGAITSDWRITGGYTYAYTENAAGVRINTINPRNIARLSTTYQLPAALDRLTVGGGVKWQSQIYTGAMIPISDTVTIRTNVRQKSYALFNLMARYDLTANMTLSANVDNLFDKSYYRRVGFYDGGYYGEPRKVTVSLRATF